MFCTQCGAKNPDDSVFCGGCGSPMVRIKDGRIAAPPTPKVAAPSRKTVLETPPAGTVMPTAAATPARRRPGVITFFGVVHSIWAAIFAFAAVSAWFAPSQQIAENAAMFLIMAALATFEFFGGYGLLRLRPFGRRFLLFWSWVMLLGIPIGTVIGILLINYLNKPETRALFVAPTPVPPSVPTPTPAPDPAPIPLRADAPPVAAPAEPTIEEPEEEFVPREPSPVGPVLKAASVSLAVLFAALVGVSYFSEADRYSDAPGPQTASPVSTPSSTPVEPAPVAAAPVAPPAEVPATEVGPPLTPEGLPGVLARLVDGGQIPASLTTVFGLQVEATALPARRYSLISDLTTYSVAKVVADGSDDLVFGVITPSSGHFYLTDSTLLLRAAAAEQSDGTLRLITNEEAAPGYARALAFWHKETGGS